MRSSCAGSRTGSTSVGVERVFISSSLSLRGTCVGSSGCGRRLPGAGGVGSGTARRRWFGGGGRGRGGQVGSLPPQGGDGDDPGRAGKPLSETRRGGQMGVS